MCLACDSRVVLNIKPASLMVPRASRYINVESPNSLHMFGPICSVMLRPM